MAKTSASIQKLAAISIHINAYSDAGQMAKDTLHSAGKSFLRTLADDLGLTKGSYDVRSSLGGVAVAGEVTLHGESIYVQLSDTFSGHAGVRILYRSCNGRKDCCGHRNHYITMARLQEGAYGQFVAQCKTLIERATATA